MADGTLRPISEIKKGDHIYTGFPDEGAGVVTEVLVHKVSKPQIRVGIISTPYGDLVGTPSHPIFFQDQWMELEDALKKSFIDDSGSVSKDDAMEQVLSGSFEIRPIDYFYNLEVDGDVPGRSSHSYVVNGIIASGLGDNANLNAMFARQEVWKTAE